LALFVPCEPLAELLLPISLPEMRQFAVQELPQLRQFVGAGYDIVHNSQEMFKIGGAAQVYGEMQRP
jgi:hypothetical protein